MADGVLRSVLLFFGSVIVVAFLEAAAYGQTASSSGGEGGVCGRRVGSEELAESKEAWDAPISSAVMDDVVGGVMPDPLMPPPENLSLNDAPPLIQLNIRDRQTNIGNRDRPGVTSAGSQTNSVNITVNRY